MNFPGVIHKDPVCLAKLEAFQGGHIDGHAPLLSGTNLNGYLSAGIRTEHECTTAGEALEKIRKGMHILVREGSVSKDLHALLPIITERLSPYLALCTDDRNPLDIAEQGHLDYMIRTAIANGVEPLAVYRAASISAARAFGLRDRGLVAPGWRADLAIIDSLENCKAEMVFAAGRFVARNDPAGKNDALISREMPGGIGHERVLAGATRTDHHDHRAGRPGVFRPRVHQATRLPSRQTARTTGTPCS